MLLNRARTGDRDAESRLTELMHSKLHRLAVRYMRSERPDHSLQPTELVNEAYLHLIGDGNIAFENRSHLLAIAARFMRHMLVDHALSVDAEKRGGGRKISIETVVDVMPAASYDYVALNDALERLAQIDERQARIVELRYFGGLTEEETAAALNVTARTVRRDWRLAKAWLYDALKPVANDDA